MCKAYCLNSLKSVSLDVDLAAKVLRIKNPII